MLKSLFSSSIRADVLSLLLNSPEERFYVREIAKLLRKNPSGVKRELDKLEEMGIVISEKVANLKYFQSDKSSPFYSELKELIAKSLGLPGALKSLLRANEVKLAFIYGPYAAASGVNFGADYGTLAAGTHNYVITVTDKAGLSSNYNGSFNVTASTNNPPTVSGVSVPRQVLMPRRRA